MSADGKIVYEVGLDASAANLALNDLHASIQKSIAEAERGIPDPTAQLEAGLRRSMASHKELQGHIENHVGHVRHLSHAFDMLGESVGAESLINQHASRGLMMLGGALGGAAGMALVMAPAILTAAGSLWHMASGAEANEERLKRMKEEAEKMDKVIKNLNETAEKNSMIQLAKFTEGMDHDRKRDDGEFADMERTTAGRKRDIRADTELKLSKNTEAENSKLAGEHDPEQREKIQNDFAEKRNDIIAAGKRAEAQADIDLAENKKKSLDNQTQRELENVKQLAAAKEAADKKRDAALHAAEVTPNSVAKVKSVFDKDKGLKKGLMNVMTGGLSSDWAQEKLGLTQTEYEGQDGALGDQQLQLKRLEDYKKRDKGFGAPLDDKEQNDRANLLHNEAEMKAQVANKQQTWGEAKKHENPLIHTAAERAESAQKIDKEIEDKLAEANKKAQAVIEATATKKKQADDELKQGQNAMQAALQDRKTADSALGDKKSQHSFKADGNKSDENENIRKNKRSAAQEAEEANIAHMKHKLEEAQFQLKQADDALGAQVKDKTAAEKKYKAGHPGAHRGGHQGQEMPTPIHGYKPQNEDDRLFQRFKMDSTAKDGNFGKWLSKNGRHPGDDIIKTERRARETEDRNDPLRAHQRRINELFQGDAGELAKHTNTKLGLDFAKRQAALQAGVQKEIKQATSLAKRIGNESKLIHAGAGSDGHKAVARVIDKTAEKARQDAAASDPVGVLNSIAAMLKAMGAKLGLAQ